MSTNPEELLPNLPNNTSSNEDSPIFPQPQRAPRQSAMPFETVNSTSFDLSTRSRVRGNAILTPSAPPTPSYTSHVSSPTSSTQILPPYSTKSRLLQSPLTGKPGRLSLYDQVKHMQLEQQHQLDNIPSIPASSSHGSMLDSTIIPENAELSKVDDFHKDFDNNQNHYHFSLQYGYIPTNSNSRDIVPLPHHKHDPDRGMDQYITTDDHFSQNCSHGTPASPASPSHSHTVVSQSKPKNDHDTTIIQTKKKATLDQLKRQSAVARASQDVFRQSHSLHPDLHIGIPQSSTSSSPKSQLGILPNTVDDMNNTTNNDGNLSPRDNPGHVYLQRQRSRNIMGDPMRVLFSQTTTESLQPAATISQKPAQAQEILKHSQTIQVPYFPALFDTPHHTPLQLAAAAQYTQSHLITGLKLWTVSLNMGAHDIDGSSNAKFKKELIQALPQLFPPGYDLYILAIQEGKSDAIANVVNEYLMTQCDVCKIPAFPCVQGRGDGSFISTKYTGIVSFAKRTLMPFIVPLAAVPYSLGITQGSKGAACLALMVFGMTFLFIGVHLPANSLSGRLDSITTILTNCMQKMFPSLTQFEATNCFHNIIFMGDTNFKMPISDVDALNSIYDQGILNKQNGWIEYLGDNSLLPPLKQLTDIIASQQTPLNRPYQNPLSPYLHHYDKSYGLSWMYSLDELAAAHNQYGLLSTFSEPYPSPLLFPTYKRVEGTTFKNPHDNTEIKASFRTRFKEAFYKGGNVAVRVPAFTDRIIFSSLLSAVQPIRYTTSSSHCLYNLYHAAYQYQRSAIPQSDASNQLLFMNHDAKHPRKTGTTYAVYQKVLNQLQSTTKLSSFNYLHYLFNYHFRIQSEPIGDDEAPLSPPPDHTTIDSVLFNNPFVFPLHYTSSHLPRHHHCPCPSHSKPVVLTPAPPFLPQPHQPQKILLPLPHSSLTSPDHSLVNSQIPSAPSSYSSSSLHFIPPPPTGSSSPALSLTPPPPPELSQEESMTPPLHGEIIDLLQKNPSLLSYECSTPQFLQNIPTLPQQSPTSPTKHVAFGLPHFPQQYRAAYHPNTCDIYSAIESLTFSDHRPVVAAFHVALPSLMMPTILSFIEHWINTIQRENIDGGDQQGENSQISSKKRENLQKLTNQQQIFFPPIPTMRPMPRASILRLEPPLTLLNNITMRGGVFTFRLLVSDLELLLPTPITPTALTSRKFENVITRTYPITQINDPAHHAINQDNTSPESTTPTILKPSRSTEYDDDIQFTDPLHMFLSDDSDDDITYGFNTLQPLTLAMSSLPTPLTTSPKPTSPIKSKPAPLSPTKKQIATHPQNFSTLQPQKQQPRAGFFKQFTKKDSYNDTDESIGPVAQGNNNNDDDKYIPPQLRYFPRNRADLLNTSKLGKDFDSTGANNTLDNDDDEDGGGKDGVAYASQSKISKKSNYKPLHYQQPFSGSIMDPNNEAKLTKHYINTNTNPITMNHTFPSNDTSPSSQPQHRYTTTTDAFGQQFEVLTPKSIPQGMTQPVDPDTYLQHHNPYHNNPIPTVVEYEYTSHPITYAKMLFPAPFEHVSLLPKIHSLHHKTAATPIQPLTTHPQQATPSTIIPGSRVFGTSKNNYSYQPLLAGVSPHTVVNDTLQSLQDTVVNETSTVHKIPTIPIEIAKNIAQKNNFSTHSIFSLQSDMSSFHTTSSSSTYSSGSLNSTSISVDDNTTSRYTSQNQLNYTNLYGDIVTLPPKYYKMKNYQTFINTAFETLNPTAYHTLHCCFALDIDSQRAEETELERDIQRTLEQDRKQLVAAAILIDEQDRRPNRRKNIKNQNNNINEIEMDNIEYEPSVSRSAYRYADSDRETSVSRGLHHVDSFSIQTQNRATPYAPQQFSYEHPFHTLPKIAQATLQLSLFDFLYTNHYVQNGVNTAPTISHNANASHAPAAKDYGQQPITVDIPLYAGGTLLQLNGLPIKLRARVNPYYSVRETTQ